MPNKTIVPVPQSSASACLETAMFSGTNVVQQCTRPALRRQLAQLWDTARIKPLTREQLLNFPLARVQHLFRCQECHMTRPCAPLASTASCGAAEFGFEFGGGTACCCADACLRHPQESAGPA